jgi:hypothetical protein
LKVSHQEMGMFGNPQIRTHFYIFFPEAVFFYLLYERLEIKFCL